MKNINQPHRYSILMPEYPNLQWCWCLLEKMDPGLLYDMLALREAVFVVEQACIYQELDGRDKTAQHLLVKMVDEVVACLRVLPPQGHETHFRIGRVAVSPCWRKRGIAKMMINSAIEKLRLHDPSCVVLLDAQTYLQQFYESLGFQVCGNEFLEDGIPHIPMQLEK